MSTGRIEEKVTELFRRVRQSFDLGMREYLAALDVVRAGLVADDEELKQILRLLWCSSQAQQAKFDLMWNEVSEETIQPAKEKHLTGSPPSGSEPPPSNPMQTESIRPSIEEIHQPEPTATTLSPLELRPPLIPTELESEAPLQSYWPIARRSMVYAWRYLRRPKPDGPPDILDIPATVERAAKVGFFLSPLYRRRLVNHARLLLLIDQGGSMTPFHRFSRDLVITAQKESDLARVDVYYFYNVPSTHLYQDAHLSKRVNLKEVLSLCDAETSVLIVSDAGAARGLYQKERIGKTTEFLSQLRQRTALVGWLNPMPANRWNGTTAEMIDYLVSMEEMSEDGFKNLIEIVRGQPLSSGPGIG